ncbi:MAG: aminopeptidase P family protein [Candidatus Omnitrophica bacterium]|nr:aminopeptidase P family protein [Candidatus Omnitrophota bacterium]
MSRTERISAIRRYLAAHRADAYLISSPANVLYLSGFTNNDCFLVLTQTANYFVGDSRYTLQAEQEVGGTYSVIALKNSLEQTLQRLAARKRWARICFEPRRISVYAYRRLSSGLGKAIRLLAGEDVLAPLRMQKTAVELACIRRAQEITRKSVEQLRQSIAPAMTELAVKHRLEQLLYDHGAEKTAFDVIIAAGEHAAMPHAVAGQRKIGRKEPVVVDVGSVWQGYNSDLTRTLFFGTMAQHNKYYRLVAAAQERAIENIRPDVPIADIDRAARQVFKKAGLERYFSHAVGHGVGLEIHEPPSVSSTNKARIKPGMVFTVEPGLYIPGWGGVRIEDLITVTERGCEIL